MSCFARRFSFLTVVTVAIVAPARAQQLPDAIPTELALALLGSRPGEPLDVRIFVGAIPPESVGEFHVPPGADILGSMVRGNGTTIVFDVAGPADSVRAAYLPTLEAAGWTLPPTPRRPGGFQRRSDTISSFACRADTAVLNFLFSQVAEELTRIRLVLNRGLGATPMCSRARMARGAVEEPQPYPLPILYTPEDDRVRDRGRSGSSTSLGSDVTLQSRRPLIGLVAFFAEQIAEAGWTSVSRHATDDFVFQTWTISDGPNQEFHGVLVGLSHPATPRQRFISFRVTRAESLR